MQHESAWSGRRHTIGKRHRDKIKIIKVVMGVGKDFLSLNGRGILLNYSLQIFFLRFIYFYCKIAHIERRKERRTIFHLMIHPSSDCSGQNWANLKPGAIRIIQVSHMGTGSQSFRLMSTVFLNHKQGAGWDAGPPGLEPVPILDPTAFEVRTLATRSLHKTLQ